jgi:hypothetical protein
MNCDRFADVLMDVLERDADERTRAAAEAHAASCAECGSLLADIRGIRAEAERLPTLRPSRDLWAGIAERIEAPVVPLPVSAPARMQQPGISRRFAAVAAAALVIVTAGVTYTITQSGGAGAPTPVVPVAAAPAPADPATSPTDSIAPTTPSTRVAQGADAPDRTPVRQVASTASDAAESGMMPLVNVSASDVYDAEIAKLRAIVDAQRPKLDTATVGVIDRNLRIIDDAILQVRNALSRDPASRFLMESLSNAYQRKIELLRSAAALEGDGGY